MSVTFSLPREHRSVTREERERAHNLPCPHCGGNPFGEGADHDCESCLGYGGDREAQEALYARDSQEDGEFNVANANAIYIVQDLLGLHCDEVYGGSLDPATVLIRLASVWDTSKDTIEPSEEQAVRLTAEGVSLGCKVISMGRSQRQCDSYVSRLRRLAEIALDRGAPEIVWG